MINKKKIAVLGGTGNLGYALAWRWARAGHEVTVGSRVEEKAQNAAAELNKKPGGESIKGADNLAATKQAEVVVLTVPFAAHKATLESIKPGLSGQVFIDTTVPLMPPKVAVVQLPEEGSAAALTRNILGDRARVTAAFHNVAANLLEQDVEIDCDILVTGDNLETRKQVMQLVEDSGCRAINAGKLANAAAAEALTSLLIHINKTYKTSHSGIRITGIDGNLGGNFPNFPNILSADDAD